MTKLSDTELKQRIYAEIPVIIAGKGLTDEQYASIMDDRKESVELMMRLIHSYAEAWAEEVIDKILNAIEKNIEASKSNLKYAKEHNNSERTLANWRGCIEGENFVKDDVLRIRAELRSRNHIGEEK